MMRTKHLNFMGLLLLFSIFWGEAIVDTQFRIFGIVITGYRVVLIISFLVSFAFLKINNIKFSSFQIAILLFLYIWLCIAFVQIITNLQIDVKEGLKEILNIVFGFCICWCLFVYVGKLDTLKQMYKYLKCITIILIFVGLIESITGLHWPISRFNDVIAMQHELSTWGITYEDFQGVSTGPFYNENDFSAALTILMPFLFYNNINIKNKVVAYFSMLGIVTIICLNGSVISLVGVAIFLSYKIYKKSSKKGKIIEKKCVMIVLILCFFLWEEIAEILRKTSMFIRFEIYSEGLKLSLNNIFFGVGPGGFETFFLQHPLKSGIVNPHNYFLEILSQYGIIVFLIFLFILIIFYIRLSKYKKASETEVLILVFDMYIISSFAPSSFIDKSFSWLPIAIGAILLKCMQQEERYAKKNI